MFKHVAIAVAATAAFAVSAHGQSVLAQDSSLEILEEAAFKQAVAIAEPSIVRIETVGGVDRVGQMLTSSAPTTGLIVSDDGYVISSAFNFISKPASILVQLGDSRRFPAKLVATDRVRMLTLLKIDAADLQPVKAAAEETIKVGQWSLALGRTYDLKNPSVSLGVVSALKRVWGKAVQTDAKVSPVNYGGPLLSIEGRAMGVLVPLSPNTDGETAGVEWYDSGIGFAIPMRDAYKSAERLKGGEDLKRGYLGVSLRGKDLYAKDVILDRVRYDSPAEKAGFKPEDIIVEVNGKPTVRQAQVRQVLWNRYAGDKVEVVVKRGEEKIKRQLELVAELKPYESGFLGVLPDRFANTADPIEGVKIRHVIAESPAAKAGIQVGDVVITCSEKPVGSATELLDVVSRMRPDEKTSLLIKRNGEQQTIDVKVGSIPPTIASELKAILIPPPNVDFSDGEEVDAKADEKAVDSKADPEKAADGEGAAEDKEEAATDKPEADKKSDLPATGRFTETLEAHKHDFWAYVPDDYNPAFEYSLMVCIHPAGDTMEATFMDSWKAVCDRRGIILVGPKAEKPSGFSLNESEFVVDCVKLMTERYNVAPSRVALHGYGNGGDFCWHLVFKEREHFRGIQVIAAGLRTAPPDNRPEYRLQVHMLCAKKDRANRMVQATLGGLKNFKYPATFTELLADEREYPLMEEIEEAARWIDSLDRI